MNTIWLINIIIIISAFTLAYFSQIWCEYWGEAIIKIKIEGNYKTNGKLLSRYATFLFTNVVLWWILVKIDSAGRCRLTSWRCQPVQAWILWLNAFIPILSLTKWSIARSKTCNYAHFLGVECICISCFVSHDAKTAIHWAWLKTRKTATLSAPYASVKTNRLGQVRIRPLRKSSIPAAWKANSSPFTESGWTFSQIIQYYLAKTIYSLPIYLYYEFQNVSSKFQHRRSSRSVNFCVWINSAQ